MKLLCKFICILAFATVAFAQSSDDVPAPREHRGSYLSVNWGLSYLSSEFKDSNFGFDTGNYGGKRPDGRSETVERYAQNNEQDSFSAWAFPFIDFRFGKAFGNFMAMYVSFGGGLFKGEGKISKQDYSITRTSVDYVLESEERKLVGVSDRTFDSYGFYGSFGLGFTVYLFQDPSSPLNGLFVGVAGGFDVSLARDNDYAQDYCTVGGVFTRYEVGKDWWVSDTWSIGVGLSFSGLVYEFKNAGEEMSHHAISLFFRLNRG